MQLHLMADALMKYETIDGDQIDQIMEGHEPDPPAGWQDRANPMHPVVPDDSERCRRSHERWRSRRTGLSFCGI